VLEVDLPSVQNIKKRRLQQRFAHLPEHVTFVPIDFATQSVETALQGTTFDPARPAVFIWEGVTQYIPEEAVSRVLTFIGKAAPGSLLVFTYVLRSIIERRSDLPGADKLMNMMDKRRTSWLFGLDPADLASFLATHHLHLLADTGNADYQERYLKPLGRELVVSECERVVQATVLPD
jgi:methyltransferase (TIGR00027 family)